METEFTVGIKPYEIKDKRVLNYQVISDPIELQKFIDWLPKLEDHETYYMTLLARNKYCSELTHIKSDRAQLKRVTTTKERMIDKLKQMECPLGSYKQKDLEIPQEAIAMYIHPNPRDMELAAKQTIRALFDKVTSKYDGYNTHQIAISNIQNARSRKVYTHFDYDHISVEDFMFIALNKMINQEACSILKTRGGFHLLVKHDRIAPEFQKTWYHNLNSIELDKDAVPPSGDLLLPMPGCMQGDFTPFFITLDGILQ